MLIKLFFPTILSFIGTFFSILFFIKKSKSLGIIDYPGERKVHKNPVPKIGGISMVIAFVPVFCVYLLLGYIDLYFLFEYRFFILATCIIIIAGICDDVYTISAFNKFIFQFAAGLIIVVFSNFKFMFHLGEVTYFQEIFSTILTILFIVGITNAINLMDGLDGLASCIYIIVSLTFLCLNMIAGVPPYLFLFFLVPFISSTFAFLKYNRFPARVFLGDTGSLLMGWSFALLTIYFSQEVKFEFSFLIPLIALSVPLSDTILVMVKRLLLSYSNGSGFNLKSMFKADNNHIHHLILKSGCSVNETVIIICGLVLGTSCITFISLLYQSKIVLVLNLFICFVVILLFRNFFVLRILKNKS